MKRGVITRGQRDAILEIEDQRPVDAPVTLDDLIPRKGLRAELFVVFFGLVLVLVSLLWQADQAPFGFGVFGVPMALLLVLVFPRFRVLGDSALFASLGLLLWGISVEPFRMQDLEILFALGGAVVYVARMTRIVVATLAAMVVAASFTTSLAGGYYLALFVVLVAASVGAALGLWFGPYIHGRLRDRVQRLRPRSA